MTTEQVAHRLIELMREGKSTTAYQELFAQDASAHEMPGIPGGDTTGLDNLLAKSKAWEEDTKELHELRVSEPLVYGHQFSVGMFVDRTKADGTRDQGEEICTYIVKDGKIQSEHFVYYMGG